MNKDGKHKKNEQFEERDWYTIQPNGKIVEKMGEVAGHFVCLIFVGNENRAGTTPKKQLQGTTLESGGLPEVWYKKTEGVWTIDSGF